MSLWVYIGIGAVFILLICARRNTKHANEEKRDKDNLAVWCNNLVDRYNRQLEIFDMYDKDVRQKIQTCQDTTAADHYGAICSNYEDSRLAAYEGLGKINNEDFNQLSAVFVKNICCEVDAAISNMEEATELLKGIRPQRKNEYYETTPDSPVHEEGTSVYYSGCDTKEKLTERYHKLVKIYHPDSGSGDPETFKKIKSEYDALIAKL